MFTTFEFASSVAERSSASLDNCARFAFAGPSVWEGSRLKDGRSDKASSDTEDSREREFANEAPGWEVRLTLDLGIDCLSGAYANDGGLVLDPLMLPRPFLGTKFKVGVLRASTAASYDRRSSGVP